MGAAVLVGLMWTTWHQWHVVAPGGAIFDWDAAGWSLVYMISVSFAVAAMLVTIITGPRSLVSRGAEPLGALKPNLG